VTGPEACAHCGATDTTRAYYPLLLGWFCVGADGTQCDTRKNAQEDAP